MADAAVRPAAAPARVLVATFAYNEGPKIRTTVERMVAATATINSSQCAYDVLVMDDGSTDGAVQAMRDLPIQILANDRNYGIGAAMKRVFAHSLERGYDILVIMAGNNKDDPTEIPRLVDPIVRGHADFVQGSRFLNGGGYGNMPAYRRFATRLHPFLFSLVVGKKVTESTNGFRAFRTALLADSRIDWRQEWLDKYELEPYLLYQAIRLGYRHAEAPVTKVYPPKKLGYTKMKPITGWWSILRPIFLLWFGLRK